MKDRNLVIAKMRSWLGATPGTPAHNEIVKTYNDWLPKRNGIYTRSTMMAVTYDWCACTVSSALISCGYAEENFFYPEISCGRLINSLKSIGCWVEDESVTPEPGWLIFYSWSDTGVGQCTTGHDHVGMVESVTNGMITTIEGNYNNKCQRRNIKVDGRYIRGFGALRYDEVPVIDDKVYQNDQLVWDTLNADLQNEYAVAGVMGNLKAESCIRSNNLQNSSAKRLGLTDEQYTEGVDNGTINFLEPVGYGICQWTSSSRKKNLKKMTDAKHVSIANLTTQVEFLLYELKTTYKKTYEVLKNATTVEEASTRFMYYYEAPASRDSSATKNSRAKSSQLYYDTYATKKAPNEDTTKIDSATHKNTALAGTYKTTTSINLRTGASPLKKKLCVIPKGNECKCYGFYSIYLGNPWYLVQTTVNGILYTGFAHSGYLK